MSILSIVQYFIESYYSRGWKDQRMEGPAGI